MASAHSIFQRNLLQGIPGVCVYIDDILVTGSTEEEHLDEVLRRLAEAGMRLKKGKCAYLLQAVDYLGHVINAEGLYMSDSKIAGILKASRCFRVAILPWFLGSGGSRGPWTPPWIRHCKLLASYILSAAKSTQVAPL